MSGTATTIDVTRVHRAQRAIETAYTASIMHPAVTQALRDLGIPVDDIIDVNFVTRSAAMRTTNPEVVRSAFYNFDPAAIRRLVPSCWSAATFDQVLDVQYAALDQPFAEVAAAMDADDFAELAALCRAVVGAACEHTEGRPLFAAVASIPIPEDDHMVVWHAARLLREHRGDGHVAALVVEGLGSTDALVVHAAMLTGMAGVLQHSRRWSDDDWQASMADLRRRGWITDDEEPTFTEEGRARRQWIEDRTNELAAVPYESIGNEAMERMISLGKAYGALLEASGLGMQAVRRELDPRR